MQSKCKYQHILYSQTDNHLLWFRYDDPSASRVSSHRQAKRRKKEAEGGSSTPQTLESHDARELEEEDVIVADEAGQSSENETTN